MQCFLPLVHRLATLALDGELKWTGPPQNFLSLLGAARTHQLGMCPDENILIETKQAFWKSIEGSRDPDCQELLTEAKGSIHAAMVPRQNADIAVMKGN